MPLSSEELQAIGLSVRVALAAVAGSLPLGIALGWLLARRNFRGKAWVETLVNLPLVLPPVVTGYLLLIMLGRHGWLGSLLDSWFGLQLVFNWKGAAIAAACVSFPLMVRAIRLTFSGVDVRLEQASRTLGVGPWRTFVRVTLPLASPGIIAGCTLAFARSIGEFGATIMIAGNIPGKTRTAPLMIYTLLESPGGEQRVRGIIVVCILISCIALAVGEWLDRRSRGNPQIASIA